ncbi:GlxA family transcriptional regulator [Nocardia sp. NPDC052566]|uniref:GlxA family transcriptional regulator n=1 Tax=Nocardia sp. NPDC052566 TaxID=3364330 RepID=UPI0037CB8DA4
MPMVAVIALDGVLGFELMIPGQVFGAARTADDEPLYEIRICGPRPRVRTDGEFGACDIVVPHPLRTVAAADIVVVPAYAELRTATPPPAVLDALRTAAARGATIASICAGAFVLAAAGLLDGRRATTHWAHASELAQRFPAITVDPAALFIDEGSVLTAAGVAAGLDMCLHLVGRDFGAAVAADAARRTIVPLHRAGGQAQFIPQVMPDRESSLAPTLDWLAVNLHRPLSLREIAEHTGVSVRTLNRRFHDQVGTAPLRWLLHARVDRAKQLLETTDLSVEQVGARTGFAAPETLRYQFTRATGTTPTAYRNTFRVTTS